MLQGVLRTTCTCTLAGVPSPARTVARLILRRERSPDTSGTSGAREWNATCLTEDSVAENYE